MVFWFKCLNLGSKLSVFVLDKRKQALMPCSEKRAKKLLDSGRARIHKLFPFCIRLTDKVLEDCVLQPLRIKLDPGSKTTGIAVVRDVENVNSSTGEIERGVAVLNLFNLIHRGKQISEALTARRNVRRRRRNQLRYRAPRFLNRGGDKKGWIAPSLQHRVDTVISWVNRIKRIAPITAISQELVRFDMQQIENPEINGIEYQQGTLFGFELKEYLLAKWDRKCAYCGAENIPLQIEHIQPKSKGGSNRVSNLTLACEPCNKKKDAFSIQEFLAKKPDVLKRILAQAKRPLKDAAAVNTTRWVLCNALKAIGLPVELGSGGLTKFNRTQLGIPKAHALDAVCVGQIDSVQNWNKPTLQIKCMGRGSHCRTRLDRFGFPRGYLLNSKSAFGFRTGDMVTANVPKGKHLGYHKGRVAIRKTGSFNIQSNGSVLQGISYKHCKLLSRSDGYGYSLTGVSHGREQVNPKGTIASQLALYLPSMNTEVSRAFR